MSTRGGNGHDDDETPGEPEKELPPGEAAEAETAEPVGLEAVPEAPAGESSTALESLRRERDQLRDDLLRRRAEFENYKKRVQREQQAAATEAAAAVFRRLVDTVDNLERALSATGGEQVLREGVSLTLRDLGAALESQGVRVLDPKGERFDPQLHQALLHEHVPGFDEGTVAEVLRKGYLYKDRLLRPALVKVASGPPAPIDSDGGGELQ